jgi:hypothetical protein
VREEVKAFASAKDAKSVPAEAKVQFLAGGFFGLLMWWLDGPRSLSVEEVNLLFRRLALAALDADKRSQNSVQRRRPHGSL